MPGPERSAPAWPSTEQIILDEIARLPDALRAPLLLCCLEGQSYEVAARRLGVSQATLRGRLHRARGRLEAKLRGRGILAAAVARFSEPSAIKAPTLSGALVESTVQFASRWSSVGGLLYGAPIVPESIAALAKGVIHAMIIQTVKFAAIAVLVSASVLATVVVAQGQRKNNPAANSPGEPTIALTQNAASPDPQPPGKIAPRGRERELDQKTKRILDALEEPIAMSFANETPLDDLLKYIKAATTTPTYAGIPIYVDPNGLREAKATVNSTIQIDREGVPLRLTLNELLKPLGLSYVVKDGFLMIDSRANVNETRLQEVERKLDKVLDALQRLEGRR